ncbi:qde-1 RNA-dependent RNA polymerase [Fusarium beomiforme]|uniref:RNA-dependent RNA polymerase n=1 Tax=Fusarium beomiforme TaxID=44412 RepID=A0A9P5A4Y2_9HYPO|nr:qde-1 RNA-dependent RNA polymerase [Fusarium beomiforme]
MMTSKTPLLDDRYVACHGDDSDGSEYSISPSLADAMAQLWDDNEISRRSLVPSIKKRDAVSAQPTQSKEHNGLPCSALARNLATIWPSCPVEMNDAPLIVKWEMYRIARHCSVELKNTSVQYTPAWENQTLFRNALQAMRCFQGKSFPEPCDTQVWLQSFTSGFKSREVVIFKAILHLDLKAGDVRLDFELPTSDKSCRLRRKFASDRFFDLQLLIRNRSKSGNQDKSLAEWLVNRRHLFLSREWAVFFIDDPEKETSNAAAESRFTEEQRVTFFAERGQGLEPYAVSPVTLIEAQPPVRAICDRSTMLNWLLQLDDNWNQPYMKLFYRISQGNLNFWAGLGLSTTTPTIVLDNTQLRNYQFNEESSTGNVMNDGIGRVSLALMRKVQNALQLDYLPAAIQGRIGSAKGIWVLDIGSQPSDIWLETYKSQRKWNCDWKDPEHRTLEVLNQSSGLKIAKLNKQFISILEDRSVNRRNTRAAIVKHMKNHVQASLDRAKEAMKQPELFRKWIHETSYASYDGMAESWFVGGQPKSWTEQMSFLSDGGFEPLHLKYLHDLTISHMDSQLKTTKDKMKIEISQSTWALIVVDFQKVLGPDEVQLCFSSAFHDGLEQRHDLEGFDVVVGRCPAHLPSDIQKVKAVFKPELRHLKDVIVFPFTGQEPLAGKLSGGDYDGDTAWICWDPDLVNNFRNAKVPQKPSFNGYFEANNDTVESLISKHGKCHYLDRLLEEAFKFHLAPKLIGKCTDYKETLSYHKNSIEDPSVINMSWLLSALVDQPKSGFIFNDDILRRFQKEYCENRVFLKQPAYKNGVIGRISEPCHIFDFLNSKLHEIINQGLSKLSQYRLGKNGDGGTSDLPTFDQDVASYWNEFEAEANNMIHQQDLGTNWLSELQSNLKRDIDTCHSYWVERTSGPNGKANFLAKVASVYEIWDSISPQIANRSPVADAVIWTLTRPSTHSTQLGTWQLLKASLTFKRYHQKERFVWSIAGRQLQFIKSSKGKVPIPVAPRTYKVLRPDGKRIQQLYVNEDRVVAEDSRY